MTMRRNFSHTSEGFAGGAPEGTGLLRGGMAADDERETQKSELNPFRCSIDRRQDGQNCGLIEGKVQFSLSTAMAEGTAYVSIELSQTG